MKNNASLVYGFFLVVGDFLALISAFVAAYILRVSVDPRPIVAQVTSREYLRIFALLLPFWLIIFGLLGLYNKNTYENRFSEFGRLVIGSFIGILFVISYSFITGKAIFPARLVTVYGFLLALCFMLLFRTIARAIRRGLFGYGVGVNNVLIIGNTQITDELLEVIKETNVTGYKVIGIVTTNLKHRHHVGENRIFKSFDEAVKKLKDEPIHSIIQTELYAAHEENSEILTFAQENHIAFRFVPGNADLYVGNIDVDLFHSIPLIAVHQTALVGWGRIVKRIFDLVIGGTLLLLVMPIMLLISLLYIFDHGSPIFRQTRLSRFGSKVRIFKFRTHKHRYHRMTPEAAFAKMGRPELAKEYRDNGDFLEDDPRVSRLGKFLRASSLDELPQLINVVKGDISLVGPRPLQPFELDQFDKKSLVLSVKSGLTGLAVISGRRDIPFDERRKLDLYYVQNWSFWNDLVILLRTISVVIFHRGAK